MDPDEVELEPASIHNHDRLTDDNPRSPGGGGDGSWACRLLRCGCDFARKAALAGAAMTAAPVVLPPLVVLSAAGVALSVPFAAYLASLAATDYLTRALLRACQPPSQPYHHRRQEFDGGVEQEFLDASEAYFRDAPPFGNFSAETARGGEDERGTPLLLPRHPGFPEASSAANAGGKAVEGEYSARESGQISYTSTRGDDTEEALSGDFAVSTSAKNEDSQVRKLGQGEFSVPDPGQQPFQSENWSEKEGDVYSKYKEEEDGRSTEENKATKEKLSQGFSSPESRVPASGDKDSVVQEKGEGEFSAQNSGQYSLLSSLGNENEQGMAMEEKGYAEEMPPRDFAASESPTPLFYGEEKDSDTSLLLPQDHGVSEARVPAFADEVRGEFSSVQESGLESYTSNRGEETEKNSPMRKSESTGKEVLPGGIGLSASAKPLFSDEDNLVQEKREGGISVNNSGQQSFQSKNWNKEEEEDGRSTEENKSAKETPSQGVNFPETPAPTPGDDGNVVQEMGGAFFVQNSGQKSFQSKNWNEKEEDGGKTREENKSNEETLSQGFYFPEQPVPTPGGDDDNVVQEKGGVFFVQNSGQQSKNEKEEEYNEKEEEYGNTREENKSNEETLSQGFYFPELCVPASSDKDNTVQEKGEVELSAQNLGQHSILSSTGDENREGMKMEENKPTEVMPLRDFVVSESSVPVLHGEDDPVQSKEGFDVAVQELLKEANSNTDLVMAEAADVQVEIIAIAAPASEVLPPGNLATREESVDVQVEIISVAAPESEMLPPSNLVARESPPNVATKKMVSEGFYFPASGVPASGGGDNVVQKKGGGELSVQSSGQQSFQSKNWNEKEEDDGRTTEENKSTEETVSQGFYFPESHVLASGDKGSVVRQKGEGEFSAQNLAPYSLPLNTKDEKEKDITMEEKKPTEDMPPRDFIVSESSVSVFRGEDDVVQSKEGFEVTVQGVVEEADSNTDLDMGEVDNVQVEIIAIAAPESEALPSCRMDLVTGEIVDVYAGIAAAVEPETESEVLHPSNLTTSESSADPETREIVDVQVDIVDAVVPESEVLPLSSLAALESQAIAETAHVGEVKNEKSMAIEEKNSTEDMPPRGSFVSESSVPVLGGEDDVAQSKEGFEVAVQELMEEANSNTDLVKGEVVDVQVEIIGIAAPESEVLPPGNFAAHDSPADPVAGEIVRVQVDIVAAAATGGEAGYTEEELREQLDALRTITGYGAVPSPTLEGELAGLYIFVGVEPSVGSSDTSDHLMELNAKLRFLKSIIGID
ncbi:uncharacterized protein LOC124647197 [Lolium rigidum]|uniref:uncharacterized protein LOC124647197 n=1 Tax=Lolium rigidum TaxID=89674 RepID=UPI001F5CD27F|nr:uncharacterized protein LOC124647197 [Lolium rigidum]XP_051212699.1 uncharacterized protein LOC127330574 [Lolium perenne]